MKSDTIEIFPWNKNFETGIPIIDSQHKKLIELLNLLVNQIAFRTDLISVDKIFDELKSYAAIHFMTEEEIWKKSFNEDTWATRHKDQHVNFISEVLKIRSGEESKPHDDVVDEIVRFLTHWLALHIIDSDKRMAKAVIALESGISIEEAKLIADREMSGTTRLMIDTIMSMYDKLAGRTIMLTREINKRISAELKLNEMMEELKSAKDTAENAVMSKSHSLNNLNKEIRAEVNSILELTGLVLETEEDLKHKDYLLKIRNSGNRLLEILNSNYQ